MVLYADKKRETLPYLEGRIFRFLSTLFLNFFILGSTPLFAMCGGDAARAFEDSLAISLNPKINARSFTTAADGSEELLEVVVNPNGIAKLKRNGITIEPGPNDTMRYWVTDSKGVRLERYITGDIKGQKAVSSFFSKTSKGKVGAGEAQDLGNKFKAMSAADQANLVGGIENKLRKGKEISEAEFLIAVKGQTGWRTQSGLLSSHLPDLQAAYRSGDVTSALQKVVDSWKTSGSKTTKGRLTRIGSLLKEQFANKPKLIPSKSPTTSIVATTGKGGDVAIVSNKGVATTGNNVSVRDALDGELLPINTDIVVAVNRPGIGIDPIEGSFKRIDDVPVINSPAKQISPSSQSTELVPVSAKNSDLVTTTTKGTEVAAIPTKGIILTSEATDVSTDAVQAVRKGAEVGPVRSRPTPGRKAASNNIDNAEDVFEFNGVLYTKAGLKAAKREALIAKLSKHKGKLIAATIIGGVSALCLNTPKCYKFIEELTDDTDGSLFLSEEKDKYSFDIETKDVDGDIHCTYKYSKKEVAVTEGGPAVAPAIQEEMDDIFTKYNLTVKWVPSEKLTADATNKKNPICIDNQNPCTIAKELADFKEEIGYTAKLMLGDQPVADNTDCKNKVAAPVTPVVVAPIETEEATDGLPSYYDEDEDEEEEARGPAVFNPDPWNILGGNTGKKFPLTPPQPLVAPRNPQMYVTPGYY